MFECFFNFILELGLLVSMENFPFENLFVFYVDSTYSAKLVDRKDVPSID